MLLASVCEFRGRYLEAVDRDAAADSYRRAPALNEAAGERRGAALAAFFLAGVGSGPQLPEYERLPGEFQSLDDERMAARVLVRLGSEYARRGHLERAVSALGDDSAHRGVSPVVDFGVLGC